MYNLGSLNMKFTTVLTTLVVSMCLLDIVSCRSVTGGARITSASSALRSTEELRDVVTPQEKKVRLTAAGSLSAEIQTSAIRAVAKLLATCGIGVWSAKKVHLCATYLITTFRKEATFSWYTFVHQN